MGLENVTTAASATVDHDKFRLRRFVEHLDRIGELERRPGTTRLSEVAQALEANPKAVLFENAGGFPLAGNVLASRTRFAAAFGVSEAKLLPEILRRLRGKPELIEVTREEAPVQAVVATGADVDLTKLPVHLQHGKDGGPFISAAMDFARDPATVVPHGDPEHPAPQPSQVRRFAVAQVRHHIGDTPLVGNGTPVRRCGVDRAQQPRQVARGRFERFDQDAATSHTRSFRSRRLRARSSSDAAMRDGRMLRTSKCGNASVICGRCIAPTNSS
jgi:hypothetical protein